MGCCAHRIAPTRLRAHDRCEWAFDACVCVQIDCKSVCKRGVFDDKIDTCRQHDKYYADRRLIANTKYKQTAVVVERGNMKPIEMFSAAF